MTISVLQEGQNTTGATPAASVSVTLTGVTAGSFIHVIGTIGFIGRTVVFSDSNSDTPTVLGSAGDTTDVQTVSHAWFGPVAAGNITFTVAPSTLTTSFNGIWVREIGQCSGVQASSNITVTGTTTAATVSSQPALWSGLGGNFNTGTAPTASTGTQDSQGWTFGGAAPGLATSSHQRVTATGSVSATYATSTFAAIAIFTESAGGGGTANLTGQTATFSEGTLGVSVSKALTGQTATFAQGSLSGAISKALTGQSATFAQGTLVPAVAYAATGQTATFTEGTLTPSTGGDVTKALSGQTATFAQGAISPAVANALSAQTITSSEGTLSALASYGLTAQTGTFTEGALAPSGSVPLAGQTAAFSQGALVPVILMAASGQSATFTPGALSPAVDTALLGQVATFTEGTLTPQTSGDVVKALTGLTAVFTVGQITASGGDQPVSADTHDPLPKRRKRQFDDGAQTQVIRESQLKPKKAKAVTRPALEVVTPQELPAYIENPEDEDELLALIQDQDEQLISTIELATHLLRTLH